jgi:processive 1,2-diacylglycerol beta-glucosyltransferase
MEGLVKGLKGVGQGWQLVVACGRNEALRARLERQGAGPHRLIALGFTDRMQDYLRAADLMVGKPGPASLFEAVAANTPLVLDAAAAMPQEGPNADLMTLHGMAVKVAQRHQLAAKIAELSRHPSALACIEAAQAAYPLPEAGKALVEAILQAVDKGRLGRAA